MYSIAFPDIFNGSKVNLNKDYDAIKVNLKSLLMSNRGGLYGDPFYGLNMKQILWDQACKPVVVELLKDEIFNAIYSYMPQIEITRDDIDVQVDGNLVQASIEVKADSKIPSNLFNIKIMLEED
jgi:phage baseplate assembly protein W